MVPDRLLVDIDRDGRAQVSAWLEGELPAPVGDPVELEWPLTADELEDLRWYLEAIYGPRSGCTRTAAR